MNNPRGEKHHSYKGPNKAEHLPSGVTVLWLERRKGVALACYIDTSDYPLVRFRYWFAVKDKLTFYAHASIGGGDNRKIAMHRLLLPGVAEIDHVDGNGLNNRSWNLRKATSGQNKCNQRKRASATSSKYKGVDWHNNRFRARITPPGGKQVHLGYFKSEKEAALARDAVARKYHGGFATFNFPKIA